MVAFAETVTKSYNILWLHQSYTSHIQGVPNKLDTCFALYLSNLVSDFQIVFFSWKLRSIRKFWIQNHFCAIFRGRDIYKTKCSSETGNSNLYCLIVASKTQNLRQALPITPRQALEASKWLLVGLVTLTDWIDVITVFILIIFKICGSSKSNNLSFDQNHLTKNPILFCKFLSPQKSHRNGFVFKIFVWIPVFRRKNWFEYPILGCRDIVQKLSQIFFGTPCMFCNFVVTCQSS